MSAFLDCERRLGRADTVRRDRRSNLLAAALVPGIVMFTVVAMPARARACVIFWGYSFVVDPSQVGVDTIPPGVPVVRLEQVLRTDPDRDCSGVPSARLRVVAAMDDSTPVADLGYRFIFDDRSPPPYMLPDHPVTAVGEPRDLLRIYWIDDDPEAPVEFSVSVVAVDRSGNESAPSAPLTIQHDGIPGCGACAVGGQPAAGRVRALAGPLVMLALALFGLRAGRRR